MVVIIFSLIIFLTTNSFAQSKLAIPVSQLPQVTIYEPDDHLPPSHAVHTHVPVHPHRDDIIGERLVAGDTWYDFQTNGALGKMIAVDDNGGVHITWTDSYAEDIENSDRHQQYNYYIPDDQEWISDGGNQIDFTDRGGFGSLCLSTDEFPRAIVFYHGKEDTAWIGYAGLDFETGLGIFDPIHLPKFPTQIAYFPQGVMSPGGVIHVAMQRRDRGMIAYGRGRINDDDLLEFEEVLREVGPTHRTTLRIAQSPHSERAAILWLNARAGHPQPEDWPGGVYAYHNNLMLAVTEDGEEWNYDDPYNITRTIDPDLDLEGDAMFGDTLRAYGSFDLIFDENDNIHVVFDARGLWLRPDTLDQSLITVDASMLFHWSEETDEITPVVDGWFTHREEDENGDQIRWPTPGAWKSNVCEPSLAYDEDGVLYCVYNYYPEQDYSEQNYCNGDIAVTLSEDNGATWYMPTMITTTRTHLAEVGQAECETYPTVADKVDDFLHISYELDTEPGTPVEDYESREEFESLCPWIYHKVPVDDIARDELYENGPNWHADYENSVSDAGIYSPNDFAIRDVYPNPFNSSTTIEYRVGANWNSPVTLSIYDPSGRLVNRIVNGTVPAGNQSVVWEADAVPAGIYLIVLNDGAKQAVRKVALVK